MTEYSVSDEEVCNAITIVTGTGSIESEEDHCEEINRKKDDGQSVFFVHNGDFIQWQDQVR